MPATGDVSVASATLFCERRDLRVDGGDTRARRRRSPRRARRPCSRATAFGARPARARAPPPRRAAATSRRVAASSRCLREPALACSSASKRCEVGARGCELGLGRRDVGLRRLAPAPGPGGCPRGARRPQQPELASAWSRSASRAPERELGVGGVEPRDRASPAATRSPSADRRPRAPARRPPARPALRSPRRSRRALRPAVRLRRHPTAVTTGDEPRRATSGRDAATRRSVSSTSCPSQRRQRDALHVRDDLVARSSRLRPGHAARAASRCADARRWRRTAAAARRCRRARAAD